MKLRPSLVLALAWMAPACGGSPVGAEEFEPGGVRITGAGTATEYVRATASTVDGEIPIPTEAITGMLRVQPMDTEGGFCYPRFDHLSLAVTSADRSVAYWRRDRSNGWRGQAVGLERRPITFTFTILRKADGVPLFQSAPVPVRFRE